VRETPRLPTKKDLLQLPRWARVAFAARCARHVQPLLRTALPDAGVRQVEAVERAIRLAEEVARQAPRWAPDRVVIRQHAAFLAAEKMAGKLVATNPVAAAVARVAAHAARTAEKATYGGNSFADDPETSAAAGSAAAAALAADPAGLEAIYRNWRELADAAEAEGWTCETAVPARFFAAKVIESESST
jgi:hypothetical protein